VDIKKILFLSGLGLSVSVMIALAATCAVGKRRFSASIKRLFKINAIDMSASFHKTPIKRDISIGARKNGKTFLKLIHSLPAEALTGQAHLNYGSKDSP